ncbi:MULTISPECIES: response regulator transcription factor [Paenibacillus]|uniref:Heme response regulator HssR n=1 Tax=Paenibacillus barengoltzii J12 TaxID=935846 RepID=A0ABY1M157_9BACL|nr:MULTISPECIES: response regulator transcription factor [Paenibacillus]MEC2343090.1 response regulator transcription factor [Paenibacillus barengoltzii]SMF53008.1 DNA-binding response regulator, OmpR family, contains REC and winged-helix (wHTH) domain [Paenibacillus barengoltzii J12]SMF57593.1 DNA-binding response regulator, OmpR family, contains REC and winged-helix (wHTH) domain [Paenibacillus barengoltzii]
MFDILVVEDDVNTQRLICAVLQRGGYNSHVAGNGIEALNLMEERHFDLVVLDLMMPEMDGYQLCEDLRSAGDNIPILMVTAAHDIKFKHNGFLVGTDDYMTKPFDEQELLFRIKALLRRAQIANERRLVVGETVLDYNALTVTRGDQQISLPQKEFYLLFKLLSYPNKIFTRLQLLEEIWGPDTETDDHTLNVHINRLRDKFRDSPDFEIVTVRGLGYKAVKRG